MKKRTALQLIACVILTAAVVHLPLTGKITNYKHKFTFTEPAGWAELKRTSNGATLFDYIKLFNPKTVSAADRNKMARFIAGRITLRRIRRDKNDLFHHARLVLSDIKNKGFKLEESRIDRSAHIAHVYYRFTMTPRDKTRRSVTMSMRLFQSGHWFYNYQAAGRSSSFFKVAEAAFAALKFDPKLKKPAETMRSVSTNL